MKILVFITLVKIVFGQDTRDQAIDTIFTTNSPFDFLDNHEEVTSAPLKSIGALTKCGEGEQLNKFVCVPYYNCNPNTNTVEAAPEIDGSRIFDVRMGDDDRKCEHYLEVCCQISEDGFPDSSGRNSTSKPGTNPTPTNPSGGTNSGTGGTGSGSGSGGAGSGSGSGGTGSGSGGTGSGSGGTESGSGSGGTGSGSGGTGPANPNPPRRVNCGIRNNNGLDFNLIGSTNEADFGEFPWMVAILRKNPGPGQQLAVCGGSLIGPKVVLTGAHCVHNINVNDIKVRAGEWDTQTKNERIPYQERDVSQKIVHEFFIKSNLYNDVALLILDRSFTKTDSIGTVCLPQDQQHFDSRECFATGWGKDIFGQQGRYAVILKKIQMPLVQNQNCQTALRKTRLGTSFKLHHSFICAGGEPNLDTCTGDGGSPLVCPDPNNPRRYLQVGIVAWGIGCGEQQVPGVYGDVSTFRNWIDTKLQEIGVNTESYTL